MSAVYGVNYTKVANGTPANGLDRAALGEKIRTLTDTYEASALADGSTITIGKALKAGDRIVGGAIYFDSLGSATVSVGDSDSAARYLAATSVSTAGTAAFAAVDGIDYVIGTNTGDTLILLTTGSAAITGTIKIVLEYVSN